MSYRTIKRVLGETSLERKCRFLFGGGLMLLISGAFYFYGQLNLKIVNRHNRDAARLLVIPRVMAQHVSQTEPRVPGDDAESRQVRTLLNELRIGSDFETAATLPAAAGQADPTAAGGEPATSTVALDDLSFAILSPDPQATDATRRPDAQSGYEAVAAIARGETQEVAINDRESGLYRYYGAVRAMQSCVACHQANVPGQSDLQTGDLIGIARIAFPLAETERTIARNNAVLLVMALVTAALAMLAAYVIVRYVIVKPVLHLKDVSDQIAHGELHQRADIRTGDEFEELSLAFNRMLRYLVSMQDDLKDANTALDKKVDELAHANLGLFEMNKIKNEFLATMSHELRTPLNSILGFSEVLSGAENLSDRQQRYVRNIDTSGRSLLALIDDILDLAKIEAGKMRRSVTAFSLADVIEHQVSAMQPIADKKTIELTARIAAELPPMRQDLGKLQQIVGNLLSNAMKFTPEGGRVRVDAARDPDDPALARIAVVDTGIGIRLDDQAVIFEKFRQGRATSETADVTTREYEGTGLGLSIVRELARLLGGEVGLQSEFGKGSTFFVRLPWEIEADAGTDEETAMQAATVDFDERIRAIRDAG